MTSSGLKDFREKISLIDFSEFKKGKNQKIESEKPKVVDLILPGFDGEWAGEDYKVSLKFFDKKEINSSGKNFSLETFLPNKKNFSHRKN